MISNIYIPTLGRLDKQTTWNGLPNQWKQIAHLVVQPHEYEEAKAICPTTLQQPERFFQFGENNDS